MKKRAIQFFFIFLMVLVATVASQQCFAQAVPDTSLNNIIRDDSVRQKKDSASLKEKTITDDGAPDTVVTAPVKVGPFQPNPKKSGLYSAILPGSGQLYNRQYWKVPLVYAAIGVTGYVFIQNYDNYQNYRKAYIGRINNPYPTDKYVNIYTTDQLNQLQNDYDRYLDLTVLFGAIEYFIQVLDAITSAHLKNFDISRDISMHVQPIVIPNGVGLGLVLNLKGHPIH